MMMIIFTITCASITHSEAVRCPPPLSPMMATFKEREIILVNFCHYLTLDESTPRVPALSTCRHIFSLLRFGDNVSAPKRFSYFFPYHIFEDRVEVFHILGTFCFRSKTIIHIEEDDSAIFSHGAEKVKNLFPIDILPNHAVSRCETKLNFGQVQGSSLF